MRGTTGPVIILSRALYGIKSSGAAWRAKLAETLMSLVYKSSEANADVWMKQDFNPNGYLYYKYMICCVGDLIQIGFKTMEDMDTLNTTYWLKEGFGPPDRYLGANVEKLQLKDGRVVLSTKFFDYLKIANNNVYNSLRVDKTALNNCGYGNRP